MVFLGALPRGDSETKVPSTLWFHHHHQHVASKSSGEEHRISHVKIFYGLDLEVVRITSAPLLLQKMLGM